mmetsp:Transcript_563/g.1234  ORF Transcript_563/g.1234 Transcript_563/m.1234 type:complete len:210 (-) Transcript_563:173-802(-)
MHQRLACLVLVCPHVAGCTQAACALSDVRAAAARLGCSLVIKAWGPAYRLELHSASQLPDGAGQKGSMLGYSDGFTQPNGVVHLESIQFRRFTGYWSRRQGARSRRYKVAPRGKAYGLGLLLSLAVCCWINERDPFSCRRMQLLAIMDEPRQHRTLVRYYRRLGFKPLRQVGDGVGSLGDSLVWGGAGLLMEASVADFLESNAPKLLQL